MIRPTLEIFWIMIDMMDDVLMHELGHSNYAPDPHYFCYLLYNVAAQRCRYAHCHSISCDLVFSASQPSAHVHWPRASSGICHLYDWNVFKMLQAASIVHTPSYSLIFSCFLTGSWCWAPNQDICISAFLYDDRHNLDFAEFTKTGPSNMAKLDLQSNVKPRNAGKWWRSARGIGMPSWQKEAQTSLEDPCSTLNFCLALLEWIWMVLCASKLHTPYIEYSSMNWSIRFNDNNNQYINILHIIVCLYAHSCKAPIECKQNENSFFYSYAQPAQIRTSTTGLPE